jgi:hypothetical protein
MNRFYLGIPRVDAARLRFDITDIQAFLKRRTTGKV